MHGLAYVTRKKYITGIKMHILKKKTEKCLSVLAISSVHVKHVHNRGQGPVGRPGPQGIWGFGGEAPKAQACCNEAT